MDRDKEPAAAVKAAQEWSAQRYVVNAPFVAQLGEPLLDLLGPIAGLRILDLGCGDGVFTAKLVAAGADVIGVDAAPEMVAAARDRGLDARLMDGYGLGFQAEFDAVVSNAALHWMAADPDAVIAGMRRALKPDGRLISEMGGHGNVAAIAVALIAVLERYGIDGRRLLPWYFPTANAYRDRLERGGFAVDYIAIIPRPTPLPTGIAGWLDTFAQFCFDALPAAARAAAREQVIGLLKPVLCDENGNWTADYVRLRLAAHKVH